MPAETNTYKQKKDTFMTSSQLNHPNRVASVSMTGNTSVDRDGRVSSTGTSTTRTLEEIDYSLLPTWTRVFRPKNQLFGTQAGFGEAEFGIFHKTNQPWKILQYAQGATPASVVVGTSTEYVYSRVVNTDPWTEDSATATDISLQWTPLLADGGHPVSGGKGADDDANSIRIWGLPSMHFFALPDIYRLPWDMAWASETVILSDTFDAMIAAGGADYSGTCSASLDFT